MSVPRSVLTAGACLVPMLVGAFGPWAKVLGIATIHGTDNGKDGWVVVGAAGVAAVFLLMIALWQRRWLGLLPLLAGGVAAATSAYDVTDINRFGGGNIASAQWGVYIALVGSVALMLASIWIIAEVRRRPAAPPPSPAEPPSPAP
jgi:hypothetical protein